MRIIVEGMPTVPYFDVYIFLFCPLVALHGLQFPSRHPITSAVESNTFNIHTFIPLTPHAYFDHEWHPKLLGVPDVYILAEWLGMDSGGMAGRQFHQ